MTIFSKIQTLNINNIIQNNHIVKKTNIAEKLLECMYIMDKAYRVERQRQSSVSQQSRSPVMHTDPQPSPSPERDALKAETPWKIYNFI